MIKFNLRTERWKTIEGYDRYMISDKGRVISLIGKTKILVPSDREGYLRLTLCAKGVKTNHRIHRLVADAFIPNPNNLPQVNHEDEIKSNNDRFNLEWCESQYNNEHTFAKYYEFIDPSGKFTPIFNLNKFCREHNLNAGHMSQVALGNKPQHKGWKTA